MQVSLTRGVENVVVQLSFSIVNSIQGVHLERDNWGIPLISFLMRRELTSSTCLRRQYTSTHSISYRTCYLEIRQVLFSCYVRLRQCIFGQYVQNGPKDEMEIMFQSLRQQGLQHNLNMRNLVIFDGRYGVKVYVRKFKGIL